MLQVVISRWRALMLMAEANHRTPQQHLAWLFDQWWSTDPEVQKWQDAAYEQWPEMREPQWWLRDVDDA
jgi:hypothetical protein